MRPLSRWTGVLCMAALVAAVACSSDGGGGGGGGTDPETGSIRATVTGDGDPLPGVTVRLFADGGSSALATLSTTSNGQVTFSQLDPGAYDVEVVVLAGFELAPGQASREDVTVEAEETATVTFALQEIVVEPTVGQIRVRVAEGAVGEPGVEVILFAGGGGALDTLDTGADGRVLFSDLDPGDYEVEITLPEDFTIAEGDEVRKDVAVTAGVTTDVQFAIVGPEETVVQVNVNSDFFSPADVTVASGTTVRWVLVSSVHTVTPDGHSEWSSATLDSPGETFEHRFDTPGDFPYFCALHAGMTGNVTVE